jgi:hypothetical protein
MYQSSPPRLLLAAQANQKEKVGGGGNRDTKTIKKTDVILYPCSVSILPNPALTGARPSRCGCSAPAPPRTPPASFPAVIITGSSTGSSSGMSASRRTTGTSVVRLIIIIITLVGTVILNFTIIIRIASGIIFIIIISLIRIITSSRVGPCSRGCRRSAQPGRATRGRPQGPAQTRRSWSVWVQTRAPPSRWQGRCGRAAPKKDLASIRVSSLSLSIFFFFFFFFFLTLLLLRFRRCFATASLRF